MSQITTSLPPPYVAPEPTPAEIENGKLKGYDPYSRLGALFLWDLSATDILAAAGAVHDSQYTRGGSYDDFEGYDYLFAQNALVLARGLSENTLVKLYEKRRVSLFVNVIAFYRSTYMKDYPIADRNSDETRVTGWIIQIEAQKYINAVALATGQSIPCEIPGMPA